MIGNFSMLLTVAEAIVSFLPAVGPAAARRSRTVLYRASHVRAALIGRMKDSLPTSRVALLRSEAEPTDPTERETLSP